MTGDTNRLTIEELEKLIFPENSVAIFTMNPHTVAIQLYDTMRENERLKDDLHAYRMTFNPMGKDIVSGFQLRNKDSGCE